MINIGYERYKKFLPVVIYTVFTLIFVGSMVRSTGSGMGCPDWPRCFGQLIPPTHIEQLPANYKEIYKVAGRQIADFSAVKTWIEYTNRLFGVWTGIAILILSVLSFKIKSTHKKIFWYTQASLILVILNGWLGSIVVKTHLHPGTITVHMILAMLLVFFLLKIKYVIKKSVTIDWSEKSKFTKLALGLLIALFIQILMGTQVREQIDHLTNGSLDLSKDSWIEKLDYIFYIHRSFSIFLLLGFTHLIRNIHKSVKQSPILLEKSNKLLLCLLGEVVAGGVLVYFHFPGIFQSLHLILSVLMISYTYEVYTLLKNNAQEDTYTIA